MNLLKAYFVVLYFFAVIFVSVGAVFIMIDSGFNWAWLGALATTLPFLGLYLWSMSVRNLPRTTPHMPWMTVLVIAGVTLAVYDVSFLESGRTGALTAAVISTVGYLLFNFWYSRFGRRINPLLDIGKQLPKFMAEDLDGGSVSSDSLAGKPALYMFYRGNWCPFCSAQVKELTGRYKEIIDRGVEVALVSPQPPDFTKRIADIFNVPFHFWVDRDNQAARTLDILHRHGVPVGKRGTFGPDTVLPTVIITDAQGQIIYTDQTDNYRVRPRPERFLAALAENGL